MSGLPALPKPPSKKYSLQLINSKLASAPGRQRRSLDSCITSSSPSSHGVAAPSSRRKNASLSSSSSSSSSSSRNSSSSASSSSSSHATADDKLNSASTKAAAWVWHQRGVGEVVCPTKRVHSRDQSSASPSQPHLPKSRFFSEAAKARAAVLQPSTVQLYDAFELSSLRNQMAQLVERLHEEEEEEEGAEEGAAEERRHDGVPVLQEEEDDAGSLPLRTSNVRAKPLDAELQPCTKVPLMGPSYYLTPLQRPKVRHGSLEQDAYQDMDYAGERPAQIGGSFRSAPVAVVAPQGAKKSHNPSLAKPFSAIHKLFRKISKAVKTTNSKLSMDQYSNVQEGLDQYSIMQEGLDQHYHYHHYHHHYHHHNYEEDCEFTSPDETYAMVRRRRFSESADATVYAPDPGRGRQDLSEELHQEDQVESPMTTWGLPAASERAGIPATCTVAGGMGPPPPPPRRRHSGAYPSPTSSTTLGSAGVPLHHVFSSSPANRSLAEGDPLARVSANWWELYEQAGWQAPREISGAPSKSSHGVINTDGSRTRIMQGINSERRRPVKQSLQFNNQKAAEMEGACSAARLRRLSDSLSDRQAALLQLDLATNSMKNSSKGWNSASSTAASAGAVSRRRHSGSFSAVKAY